MPSTLDEDLAREVNKQVEQRFASIEQKRDSTLSRIATVSGLFGATVLGLITWSFTSIVNSMQNNISIAASNAIDVAKQAAREAVSTELKNDARIAELISLRNRTEDSVIQARSEAALQLQISQEISRKNQELQSELDKLLKVFNEKKTELNTTGDLLKASRTVNDAKDAVVQAVLKSRDFQVAVASALPFVVSETPGTHVETGRVNKMSGGDQYIPFKTAFKRAPTVWSLPILSRSQMLGMPKVYFLYLIGVFPWSVAILVGTIMLHTMQ